MENIKETTEPAEAKETCEEIIKPDEQIQQQQQQQLEKEDNPIQQQQEQQQQQQQQDLTETPEEKEQQPQVEEKQIETPTTPPAPVAIENQPLEPQTIAYEEPNEDADEDEDDDDEEKETSQKLVIDIPDEEEDEEEEEEEEKEDIEEEDNDVIALDDLPAEVITQKEKQKLSPKPEVVDTIITLSDGEEDVPATEETTKPGKVQKRRSMGAGSVAGAQDEEHFRLKRRKINVAGAPKMPLTGYVRYMNDRRDSLRKEYPSKTAMEHTKMIGEEWHALPSDVKANYLKAADVDKQRYVKELHSFLKSRPDILASELAKNKIRKTAENNSPNPSANANATSTSSTKPVLKEKTQINETAKSLTKDNNNTKDKMSKDNNNMPTASTSQQANEKTSANEKNKRKRTPTPPTSTTNNNNNNNNNNNTNASTSATAASSSTNISSTIVTPTPGEIPIFTNEFLEHNKIYDMELRSLRKSKTDLEQQNSVLEKHVENMKFGVEKMITENNELEEKNRLLEIYLDKLKRKLALALGGLPLPSAPNGATVDNIDKYMQDLYKMSTSNSHGPATLNKAKDIIRKLDLQIQL